VRRTQAPVADMGWSDLKHDLQRFLEWADVSVNCAETESAMQRGRRGEAKHGYVW